MRPLEALKTDWGLYYGNTYMLVDGVVHFIMVSNTDEAGRNRTTMLGRRSQGAAWQYLDPAVVEPWWPRAGSYNFASNGGTYIGRESRRSMKKSAQSPDHYKVVWGMASRYPMWEVAKGPRYKPFATALKLRSGYSAAVNASLILANVHNKLLVVYRGEPVG